MFFNAAFSSGKIITIKLDSKRSILFERIKKKKKKEQGSIWLFSKNYNDKFEFVRKLFNDFKNLPANIKIDTTNLNKQEVYKIYLNS